MPCGFQGCFVMSLDLDLLNLKNESTFNSSVKNGFTTVSLQRLVSIFVSFFPRPGVALPYCAQHKLVCGAEWATCCSAATLPFLGTGFQIYLGPTSTGFFISTIHCLLTMINV